MIELAYVEGKFVPLGDAKVSIEDRGFVFADGVYEVIVAYNGRPFRLAEHLARLMKSAEAILLPFPEAVFGTQ
jgi:D-alanine transaminase